MDDQRDYAEEEYRFQVVGNTPADSDRDRRDPSDAQYSPREALAECHDLWANGAWPDTNAADNLTEVMDHVGRLLRLSQ